MESRGLRETTLPIESRVVDSCKGEIPDCVGGVSLSVALGWDSRRACVSRPIRGQKQNLGRLKPTCGKHRLHKLAIPRVCCTAVLNSAG